MNSPKMKWIHGIQVPAKLCRQGFCTDARENFNAQNIQQARIVIKKFLEKAPTIQTFVSSYGLKHSVEQYVAAITGQSCYIANGELIAAMCAEGFDVKQDDLNGNFNIDKTSFEDFQKEVSKLRNHKSKPSLTSAGDLAARFTLLPAQQC